MSSVLFSTSCYINTEPYHLRLCIDDDSKELSGSNIDDILLTSNVGNILDSMQLQLESLNDKKKNSSDNNDDTIPETIPLNKLLNIKQSSNEESTQFVLSYVDISESFILVG